MLEQGSFDPTGGHARAARTLDLSRTPSFRRLATAVDRLTEALIELRSGGGPAV